MTSSKPIVLMRKLRKSYSENFSEFSEKLLTPEAQVSPQSLSPPTFILYHKFRKANRGNH